MKRALEELGKDLTEGMKHSHYPEISHPNDLFYQCADEVSMLLLSVGARPSMGMTFSQYIDFYDKQATLSVSEHPSLEDNLDTFVAMGGR